MSISGQSLPDCMCQALRLSTAATAAFGDTYNSSLTILQNQTAGNICKFWSDYADQILEPYLVFEEIGESYTFMTRGNAGTKPFTCMGNMICRIDGVGRASLRALGILVCAALNDIDVGEGPVTWPGISSQTYQLMELRMIQAAFVPSPAVGPGIPSTFNRVISFEYTYEGLI